MNETLYKEEINKSLNFHHERNYDTGVVKEGIFFNYESIDAEQSFEGWIIGEENDLNNFWNNLNIANSICYLGRSKNNQYGKVKFEIISDFKEFLGELENIDIKEDEISITLLSDTIIYNENGFSTTDISDFQELIGCKIKKAFIKSEDAESFISVWKLRSPSETCFKAGSSFLIEINEDNKNKLFELQKKGIGERTNEGFGRFTIGWQKAKEIKERDSKHFAKRKPNEPIPEQLQKIIKNIIYNLIERKIKFEAIRKAKEFKNIPPKSLLFRLLQIVNKDKNLKEELKNLKKKAIDHLEKSKSEDFRLKDFIEEFQLDLAYIIKNIKVNSNNDLKDLIGVDFFKGLELEKIISDEENIKKLYKYYFNSFFNILIKRKKGEQ